MQNIQEGEILTIAGIREHDKEGRAEYLFNERQQFFTLHEGVRRTEELQLKLRDALRNKHPILVLINEDEGTIRNVESLSSEEIDHFFKERTLLDKPARPRKVEISKINPTTFNIVDAYLKFPAFLLCKKIVPSYTRAKEIFDYCAAQSCHLPGPYSITSCIPFQYVRDGCFARAHKMRWIVNNRYGYCCEKVFSFAIVGNDKLAVRANKWGGCCVTWWYHVAPLIRMRVRIPKLVFPGSLKGGFSIVLAMVIDPSMFDKPVLLSSWLNAQEEQSCHANAHVSKYSIQPGSAYTPANGIGTAFSTDPNYTLTNAALNFYKNMDTCP